MIRHNIILIMASLSSVLTAFYLKYNWNYLGAAQLCITVFLLAISIIGYYLEHKGR